MPKGQWHEFRCCPLGCLGQPLQPFRLLLETTIGFTYIFVLHTIDEPARIWCNKLVRDCESSILRDARKCLSEVVSAPGNSLDLVTLSPDLLRGRARQMFGEVDPTPFLKDTRQRWAPERVDTARKRGGKCIDLLFSKVHLVKFTTATNSFKPFINSGRQSGNATIPGGATGSLTYVTPHGWFVWLVAATDVVYNSLALQGPRRELCV